MIELITDRYPLDKQIVLIYDLIEGYVFGYYDPIVELFYSYTCHILNSVAGWAKLEAPAGITHTMSSNMSRYIPSIVGVSMKDKETEE